MKKSIAKILVSLIKNKDKKKIVYDVLTSRKNIQAYKNILNPIIVPIKGYVIQGKNNKIIVVENGIERPLKDNERIEGLNIKINGNNNFVKLELPIMAENSIIEIGNDNVIVDIGTTNCFFNVFIRCCFGNKQYCQIGKKTTIFGAGIILDADGGCIIGEDCMLSNSIRIWGTDGHSIIDMNTKELLNTSKGPVVIGNHSWIGEGARITKNARIGNDCIIGGGTVAYKDYGENNVVIAGNPGKIVKRGISWSRDNTYSYKK